VRATKTPIILEKMRRMDQAELEGMSGKEMAARFGAARSTCEAARKTVRLARIADK
jgi:transposase